MKRRKCNVFVTESMPETSTVLVGIYFRVREGGTSLFGPNGPICTYTGGQFSPWTDVSRIGY
jgi:hypothetical protein